MASLLKLPAGAPLPGSEPEDPPAPLVSAWRARAEAGEPVAVVRVRDLQGQGAVPVGRDAWGRPGRPQPVLLSAEVSFARPFGAASEGDRLGAETVHYGTLSKSLLAGLELCRQGEEAKVKAGVEEGREGGGGGGEATPLLASSDVFELLWVRMTGRVVDGSRVELPPDQVPFLPDPARLRALSLTLRLPKASLLGAGGVSLTTTACFREGPGGEGGGKGGDEKEGKGKRTGNPLSAYSRTLRLHGLHVPTLIGVNENERKARQMVVADIEIDRYDVLGDDVYADLERTVVEVSQDRATQSRSFSNLFHFFLPSFLFYFYLIETSVKEVGLTKYSSHNRR